MNDVNFCVKRKEKYCFGDGNGQVVSSLSKSVRHSVEKCL